MTPFRSGLVFLFDIIAMCAIPMVIAFFSGSGNLGMAESVILSESIGFVPALLFAALFSADAGEAFPFRKIRISTLLFTVLLVILLEPLMAALNTFSMFFSENVVAAESAEMIQDGFSKTVFIVAILGPMAEELVFRGIIYSGLRKSGRIIPAILLQAIMFGFMHMNFNQMSYAIALGVFFGILTEITGSIWPSFFAHFLVNFTSTLEVFLLPDKDLAEAALQTAGEGDEELMIAFLIFSILSVFTTALACCVLFRIAKNEPGGEERLKRSFRPVRCYRVLIDRQGRLILSRQIRVLTLPAALGLILSFCMMLLN